VSEAAPAAGFVVADAGPGMAGGPLPTTATGKRRKLRNMDVSLYGDVPMGSDTEDEVNGRGPIRRRARNRVYARAQRRRRRATHTKELAAQAAEIAAQAAQIAELQQALAAADAQITALLQRLT